MAKKSMIARDKKRLALIAKYADKRAELLRARLGLDDQTRYGLALGGRLP